MILDSYVIVKLHEIFAKLHVLFRNNKNSPFLMNLIK